MPWVVTCQSGAAPGSNLDAAQVNGLGGTYRGNPIACAAALATIETIKADGLTDRAREIDELMLARLQQMQFDDDRLGADTDSTGTLGVAESVSASQAAFVTAAIIACISVVGTLFVKTRPPAHDVTAQPAAVIHV